MKNNIDWVHYDSKTCSKELEVRFSKEELKKIKNILDQSESLRHYRVELETGDYLELVEFKDYEKIEQERDYYKNIIEEIKNIFDTPDNIFEDGCPCKLIEDKLEELEKGDNYAE